MNKEYLKINCLICGKEFKYLGSHIFHKHKIRAKDYKEMFKLPHNLNLISDEIREKKQIAFNKDREKYLKNILDNKKYQFKKGHKGRFRTYRSEFEKEQKIKNILKVKLKGVCPICKTSFNHLQSHLFNKHKLIYIDKVYK